MATLTFQQLALDLVQSVKTLSQVASAQIALSDKQIEAKLTEITNVVQLGFQMPVNMAISLTQILTKLLITIEVEKDFLLLQVMNLLEKISSTCDQKAFKHEGVEMATLELTKWGLILIKDKTVSTRVTSDLQSRAIDLCQTFIEKGVFCSQPGGVLIILPGVSSVCSKALSFDYKCSAKVRQSLIQLWGAILQRSNLRSQVIQPNTLTLKPEEQSQNEDMLRLKDCFCFVLDNIHKNIRNQQVLKALLKLTFDLICSLPICELSYYLFTIYLFSTWTDPEVERLPKQAPKKLKNHIQGQFLHSVNQLARLSKVISDDDRTCKLLNARLHCMLVTHYQIAISQENYQQLSFSLLQLVQFQSPRFLIQEVAKIKKETSPHYVDQFFAHTIFNDDLTYVKEFKSLMETLPEDVKVGLCYLYTESFKDLPSKEVSAVLQQKCAYLYLIACLDQPSSMHELILPLLSQVTFETKYPIQEKYYACLYYNLYLSTKTQDPLDIQSKTRVFTMALSGLSSKLEIVACLSFLILEELQIQFGCYSIPELLSLDNGYFFNNLFAKLRYFNQGMTTKHLLLTMESLKLTAPQLLADNLVELCELVGGQIDQAMTFLDQPQIVTAIDMLISVTGFVYDQSISLESCIKQQTFDVEKVQPKQHRKTLTNVLRLQILRVQPYMTAQTTPQLSYKALQVFQNCVPYLANRPMVSERNAENFSAEDQPNAVIPCAMSAIGYEVWSNISSMLASAKPQSQAKVYELLATIAFQTPQFLITSNRFTDIIKPKVQQAIASVKDADLLTMHLLKSQAKFLKQLAWGYFKFDAVEQTHYFDILNAVRGLQYDMRQKLNLLGQQTGTKELDSIQGNRVKEVIQEIESDNTLQL